MANSKHFNQPEMSPALFIGGTDKSFYIPAYQRYFAWGEENIKRLFEDIVEDMGQRLVLENRNFETDTVSFIGTILCYENASLSEIHPQIRNQVPKGVLCVIDGQQRLTVLITLSIILHDYIRNCSQTLPNNGWLYEKCVEQMEDLANMFRTTRPYGDVRLYPKMIRAFDDQWSTNAADKQYRSPVSYYAFCYGDFLQHGNNPNVRFSYDGNPTLDLDSRQQEAHVNFLKAVNQIKNIVHEICSGRNSTFPDVTRIFDTSDVENLSKSELLQDLFNTSELPCDAVDFEDQGQCSTARAILLAAYIMRKVYFVSLVTKDEHYAFNIFDSLNTTGEPLTAYETFMPEVIRHEKLDQFRYSDAKKHLERIDEYLEENSKLKIKRTEEMLVTFALAESGETLSQKVHIQRKHMKDSYRKCGSKDLFTEHLMHVSDVWRLWSSDQPNVLAALGIEADPYLSRKCSEANFCLRFLKDARHTIALALISRFYAIAKIHCVNRDAGHLEKAAELCDVIKAVAAFFAVWRSSRPGTDGIESLYRKLIKKEFSRTTLGRAREDVPPLMLVQANFCDFLKKDGGNSKTMIDSKDTWRDQSRDIPVGRTAKAVAKFVLLLAAHNTRPDPDNSVLMKKVRGEIYQFLIATDIWDDDDYGTIEHICPQSHATDKIPAERLHRIGNLTILPRAVNSILGDDPWSKKQVIYRLLSGEEERELKKAAEDARAAGVSTENVQRFCKSRYLPMTRTVAEYEDFYVLDEGGGNLLRAEYIESRGENILENAWEVLSEWLDFDAN